jgi:hypothetical protein
MPVLATGITVKRREETARLDAGPRDPENQSERQNRHHCDNQGDRKSPLRVRPSLPIPHPIAHADTRKAAIDCSADYKRGF